MQHPIRDRGQVGLGWLTALRVAASRPIPPGRKRSKGNRALLGARRVIFFARAQLIVQSTPGEDCDNRLVTVIPPRNSAPASNVSNALGRFASPVILLALMWLVQTADAILPGSFTGFGLRSWDLAGLGGIVLGPLLHANWGHLIANSVPFLVLGCLVAVEGARRFWAVTVIVAIVGGIGTWLVNAPGTLTVGASGLVFGYFGYVVLRVFLPGRVAHRILYAVIALIVISLYGGSMLAGVFGAADGVSWQGHLFGAVGGGVAAFAARRRRADRLPSTA